MSGLVRTISYL